MAEAGARPESFVRLVALEHLVATVVRCTSVGPVHQSHDGCIPRSPSMSQTLSAAVDLHERCTMSWRTLELRIDAMSLRIQRGRPCIDDEATQRLRGEIALSRCSSATMSLDQLLGAWLVSGLAGELLLYIMSQCFCAMPRSRMPVANPGHLTESESLADRKMSGLSRRRRPLRNPSIVCSDGGCACPRSRALAHQSKC